MAGLTASGLTAVGLRSLSRKSVLKPKQLWTPVLRNLDLSPVRLPKANRRANFLHKNDIYLCRQ